MRVDVLLKSLCLVKTRSQGRKGCEAGRIKLNGRTAKPSREVKRGDLIEIQYPGRVLLIEVTDVPAGQLARRETDQFYRVVRETPRRTGGDAEF
jgi:ribosomal 50S subunit-recycling heat shock protein